MSTPEKTPTFEPIQTPARPLTERDFDNDYPPADLDDSSHGPEFLDHKKKLIERIKSGELGGPVEPAGEKPKE